jgi:hypothetical protein
MVVWVIHGNPLVAALPGGQSHLAELIRRSSTVAVVLWDESGDWHDHVSPPQLPNSVGLDARVPVIVISPYARSGAISHQQTDFVSIRRFIEWNWGLGAFTDPAQSAREQHPGDLCDVLTIPCSFALAQRSGAEEGPREPSNSTIMRTQPPLAEGCVSG